MTIHQNIPILHGRGYANETEAEYQRVLAIIELLMNKESSSLEENRLLDLFVILVDKFELEHYPSQNLSTPRSRLLHLMETNNLQPTDLIGVFGSQDLVAEVMDGRRSIDKYDALKLSDRFNLHPSLFLAK